MDGRLHFVRCINADVEGHTTSPKCVSDEMLKAMFEHQIAIALELKGGSGASCNDLHFYDSELNLPPPPDLKDDLKTKLGKNCSYGCLESCWQGRLAEHLSRFEPKDIGQISYDENCVPVCSDR